MKKNAVILSVDDTGTDAASRQVYRDTLEKIDWHIEGLEKLGQNVWLIPLPCGVPALGRVVSVCEHLSFKYRLLHIDHEPVWVSYGNK